MFTTGDEASARHETSEAQKHPKQAALNRMRRTATCLLAVMLVVLLTSAAFQPVYSWLSWVRAFAEAGTVGAIADWYAVVALFRRPFGLRIPHTAIIPRNQRRIGESIGQFVEQHFLTPENVIGRLRAHNTANALALWLVDPANSRAIAGSVAASLPGLMRGLDDAELARFFERALIPQLRGLDASRVAGNILKILTDNNRHHPLLNRALEALEQWLVANAGLLKAKFSEASRYTPAQLDNYIVDKFVEGIVSLLHEVVEDPHHNLRSQFDAAMQVLVTRLQTSGAYRGLGLALMRDFIRHLRSKADYRALWDRIRTRMTADVDRADSLVHVAITGLLVSFGERLRDEPTRQRRLNAWWLLLANRVIRRYRHQIPALITEVVNSWNAEEVGRKIEAEIGRDLQYIRINGTFVGGAVGVLLHAAVLLVTR
jgi:uncharacterized membrane-anchored protein YjiN (DUF445 family)